jgi:hypothetical protein
MLEIGDAILFHGPDDLIEHGINKLTGKYHHIAMFIGHLENEPMIFEAQYERDVHYDHLFQNDDDFDVFTPIKQFDGLQKRSLLNLSKSLNGKKYDKFGAAKNIPYIGWLFKNNKNRYYCNELYAYMTDKVGHILIFKDVPTAIAKNKNMKFKCTKKEVLKYYGRTR